MSQDKVADGVQFNWNLFPSTRLEAKNLQSPIGCLYTPLHQRPQGIDAIPVDSKYPLQCDICSSYINPYVKIDRTNGMWWCPFCEEKTYFPDNYPLPAANSPMTDWPVEFHNTSSTMEYILPRDVTIASENYCENYVFIIDLYQHTDEMQLKDGNAHGKGPDTSFNDLKAAIVKAINSVSNANIAIITYDEHVYVHQPSHDKSIAITARDVDRNLFSDAAAAKILAKLEIAIAPLTRQTEQNGCEKIFVSDKQTAIDYVNSLKPKFTNSYKPARSTGLAAYVVSTLLSKASYRGFMSKVMLFASGPCTVFPGNIIDTSKTNSLRSHHDIVNLSDPEFVPALKFYKTLSLVAMGLPFDTANTIISASSKKETDFPLDINNPRWSFDIYSGSLDQVGVYEMKHLALHTMGDIFIYESFQNYKFAPQLLSGVQSSTMKNSTLSVNTSPNLKISRLVGPGHSLPSSYQADRFSSMHQQKISDQITDYDSSSKKKNFTNQWFFNQLKSDDTMVILFDPETARSSDELVSDGIKQMYIQFQVKFWDPQEKSWKLRVTTISKKTTLAYLEANKVKMSDGTYRLVNSKSKIVREKELIASFDQYAFMIILSRLLLDKIDTILGFETFDNIVVSIDKVVVKLLKNFGGISLSNNSTENNPYMNLLQDISQKYIINENFKEIPVIAYYLRRNPQLIRIFNSLPDETAFYHHWFMKMNSNLSLKVIKPVMYKLSSGVKQVVTLDAQNVFNSPPDSFIIMDSVFIAIIYQNNKSLKLHHSDNMDLIKNKDPSILEPLSIIDSDRPFFPKCIITQKDHSQARFLLSRLNPAEDIDHEVEEVTLQLGFFSKLFGSKPKKTYSSIFTDDISLNAYYDALINTINQDDLE